MPWASASRRRRNPILEIHFEPTGPDTSALAGRAAGRPGSGQRRAATRATQSAPHPGAGRRDGSAQLGRLPARGRRCRRACRDRPQRPCSRHQCHSGQGGQRCGGNGAVFHGYQPGAYPELKERSIWIIGTSDTATSTLYQSDLKGPVALVLGAEGAGMRQLTAKTCDALVSIPMRGAVESLNVSVASGVCLYEALRQRSVRPGGVNTIKSIAA